MRAKDAPDGLLRFEAAMAAKAVRTRLLWVDFAKPACEAVLHAAYALAGVDGPVVYVEALPGDRWRAFIRVDAPEALRAAVATAEAESG